MPMETCVESFERKVSEGLAACLSALGHEVRSVGVAVSGGADSVSLAVCLSRMLPASVSLRAITVNHALRPDDETCGDALFVQELCGRLGIPCRRVDVPRGKIARLSKERGCGTEEAARFVRYEAFSAFVREEALDVLCTAHTLSDVAETQVMRFLQGSGAEGLGGIPAVRLPFVRPLRAVGRDEVEAYLAALGQGYRTDSTNGDTSFLRNRIRSSVVPQLDVLVPGWKKSVLALSQKMADDEAVLSSLAKESFESAVVRRSAPGERFCMAFCAEKLSALPPAVFRRVMYLALSASSAGSRVPFRFISDCRELSLSYGASPRGRTHAVTWGGFKFFGDGGSLVLERDGGVVTESGFFAILEEPGSVRCGRWSFCAAAGDGGVTVLEEESGRSVLVPSLSFPFALRSPATGDFVRCADGTMRSVRGILDGWKAGSLRSAVPLVQDLSVENQPVLCVWGELLGFENWIVRKV